MLTHIKDEEYGNICSKLKLRDHVNLRLKWWQIKIEEEATHVQDCHTPNTCLLQMSIVPIAQK